MKGPACLTPRFLRVERALRRELRKCGALAVYLRRDMVRNEKEFGCAFPALDTARRRWVFVIHLDEGMSEQEAIDTAIHEAAHVLAWKKERTPHDDAWGKAYARCYRICLRRSGRGRA